MLISSRGEVGGEGAGAVWRGSPRQVIVYDYNYKSNENQRLKSKKQIHRGVRIGSSL